MLKPLTSLRFFAAMAVLLSHLEFLENSKSAILSNIYDLFFRQGYCGVTFFFMLSGFILAHVYGDRLSGGQLNYSAYLFRRLGRILPLHWLVGFFFILWLGMIKHEPPRLSTAALNLLLLHSWVPDSTVHYSLNGPAWSLSDEFFFYAAFPFLIRLRPFLLCWTATLLAAGMAAAALISSVNTHQYSPAGDWFFYVNPVARLLEFILGMLLYRAYRAGVGRQWSNSASEIALLAAVPMVMLAYATIDLPMPFRYQLAYIPLMAALLLVFAHGRGALSRGLAAPQMVLLGEASFALYLTHRPLVTVARAMTGGNPLLDLVVAVALVPTSVIASLFVYRLFEVPVQAWLRGDGNSGRQDRSVPAKRRIHQTTSKALSRQSRPWRGSARIASAITALAILAMAIGARISSASDQREEAKVPVPVARTTIGINLSNLATYTHQQVFNNLVAQSEWFHASGGPWSIMPADRLDAHGWVRYLKAGEVAPRPLVLPPPPIGRVLVRCTFSGNGELSAGGIAHLLAQRRGLAEIELVSENKPDEGAWVQLDRTDPADPLRDLVCRDSSSPAAETFAPEFISFMKTFSAVRFLDWQSANSNRGGKWQGRTLPGDSTQLAEDGAAIEHMIELANLAGVDPWFLMPYNADAEYITKFSQLVHQKLAPSRTVYVELGNEVWNDMFEAAKQARSEGMALGLAADPMVAQMRRYAQKSRATMEIWTATFADRPHQLVRVVSTLNVYPQTAEMVLGYEDMARWVDALATAPYIHLDLDGRRAADTDWVFGRMDGAIAETIDFAAQNKAIAAAHGKRYIAYEGGQHLVTRDIDLARRIQRDARMAKVYEAYLTAWKTRIGDRMMLYASTGPIGEAGSWGLREYAGQDLAETPKLRAVRSFLLTQP